MVLLEISFQLSKLIPTGCQPWQVIQRKPVGTQTQEVNLAWTPTQLIIILSMYAREDYLRKVTCKTKNGQ